MTSPGASRLTRFDEFEKLDTASDLLVEPTPTAVEMHAGALIESIKPSFPEDATVAILALRN